MLMLLSVSQMLHVVFASMIRLHMHAPAVILLNVVVGKSSQSTLKAF